MDVVCGTVTVAGLSDPIIPAKQGQTIVITAIAVQNESAVDITAVVSSKGVDKRRVCMPNKGDGFDRVYHPKRELTGELGGDLRLFTSAAGQVGYTVEFMYR